MKRSGLAGVTVLLALATSCIRGLPPSVLRQISDEHTRLQEAAQQLDRSQHTLADELTKNRDLFAGATPSEVWQSNLKTAAVELDSARNADRRLFDLRRNNRQDSRRQVDRLLTEEARLRESAITQIQGVDAAAAKWVNFKRDLPANLARMQREYDALHSADLVSLSTVVQHAGHDWPGKQTVLETRLASIEAMPAAVDKEWTSTETERREATAGAIGGPQLATLIQADDTLSGAATKLKSESEELRSLSGQLYDSWDKILTDLDRSDMAGDALYRERIKTIRTHISDFAENKTETSSSEHWINVSEPAFHAVENDIGMAISHKDAGVFDSEAEGKPQPPGFAYIAPESQGSNQYGYWDHHTGAEAVWVWLPRYLLLRELLWNRDYRPVVINEYRGYSTAQAAGRTFYGQTTPAAPPKYGTHGTFTESHYAGSRYAQSGGFKNSPYASARAARPPEPEHPGSFFTKENEGGKRFGFGAGPSSGRRFGQNGAMRGMGRSFGRRR